MDFESSHWCIYDNIKVKGRKGERGRREMEGKKERERMSEYELLPSFLFESHL